MRAGTRFLSIVIMRQDSRRPGRLPRRSTRTIMTSRVTTRLPLDLPDRSRTRRLSTHPPSTVLVRYYVIVLIRTPARRLKSCCPRLTRLLVSAMNDEASSDGSSAAGPALPAGVLKTRTAWAGDELEMDHTREQIRRGADDEVDHQATHAAVDISQFHNKEVGSGYQARHVVRQKTGPGSDGIKVRGLTGGTSSFGETEGRGEKMESDKKKKKKAKKTKKNNSMSAKRKRDTDDNHDKYRVADQYLQCKGVREFRIEIEKILRE